MRKYILLFVFVLPLALIGKGDSDLYKKCSVDVKYSINGEDAAVTVTVKNGAKLPLHDPVVRVTFFDADGKEVASDAKAYFAVIKKGARKKMETRIWSYVPNTAKKAEGKVVGGYFE